MSSTEGMGLLEHVVLSELKGFSNEPCTDSSLRSLRAGMISQNEQIESGFLNKSLL